MLFLRGKFLWALLTLLYRERTTSFLLAAWAATSAPVGAGWPHREKEAIAIFAHASACFVGGKLRSKMGHLTRRFAPICVFLAENGVLGHPEIIVFAVFHSD